MVVLPAESIIQWRALQVVTATPYLPAQRLSQVFPGAQLNPAGFHVPIRDRAPEEVLADCLTHEIPVLGSSILYCVPSIPPQAVGSHWGGERAGSAPRKRTAALEG